MVSSSLIQTGVDKLISLIEERGKISVHKAARELGVSKGVVEGWAKFLEEEDLITTEYSLTEQYLVFKKLSRLDVLRKAKEFKTKKESFISKASVTLNFLAKEGEKLRKSKTEFDNLKKELGLELDRVKDELKDLERYDKLKTEIDLKLNSQKSEMEEALKEYDLKIKEEQRKTEHLLGEIEKEESLLIDEEKDTLAIEDKERSIIAKMELVKKTVTDIEERIEGKKFNIKEHMEQINKLKDLAKEIKKGIDEKKKELLPMIEDAKAKEVQIEKMQEKILSKISKSKSDIKETKEITDKFKRFFDQNLQISELITKINKDRDELEQKLRDVLRKAQAFQITGREKDVSKNIIELERMFGEVDKKKSFFEQELNKLKNLIKKK